MIDWYFGSRKNLGTESCCLLASAISDVLGLDLRLPLIWQRSQMQVQ